MPKMNVVLVSIQNKELARASVHATGITQGSSLSFHYYNTGLEETAEVQVPINLSTMVPASPPCTTQTLWKEKNPQKT